MSTIASPRNDLAQDRARLTAALRSSFAPGVRHRHAGRARCGLDIGTARRGRVRPHIVAAAAVAVALSGCAEAWAQTSNQPSNAPARAATFFGPKQVGPWEVTGKEYDNGSNCTAQRPVRGAAGRGTSLYFGFIRARQGYWLGLGAEDWELKLNTTF